MFIFSSSSPIIPVLIALGQAQETLAEKTCLHGVTHEEITFTPRMETQDTGEIQEMCGDSQSLSIVNCAEFEGVKVKRDAWDSYTVLTGKPAAMRLGEDGEYRCCCANTYVRDGVSQNSYTMTSCCDYSGAGRRSGLLFGGVFGLGQELGGGAGFWILLGGWWMLVGMFVSSGGL